MQRIFGKTLDDLSSFPDDAILSNIHRQLWIKFAVQFLDRRERALLARLLLGSNARAIKQERVQDMFALVLQFAETSKWPPRILAVFPLVVHLCNLCMQDGKPRSVTLLSSFLDMHNWENVVWRGYSVHPIGWNVRVREELLFPAIANSRRGIEIASKLVLYDQECAMPCSKSGIETHAKHREPNGEIDIETRVENIRPSCEPGVEQKPAFTMLIWRSFPSHLSWEQALEVTKIIKEDSRLCSVPFSQFCPSKLQSDYLAKWLKRAQEGISSAVSIKGPAGIVNDYLTSATRYVAIN